MALYLQYVFCAFVFHTTDMFSHMLAKTPSPIGEFKQDILVYHAPDYVLTDPGNVSLKISRNRMVVASYSLIVINFFQGKYGLNDKSSFSALVLLNGETVLNSLEKAQRARISSTDKEQLAKTVTGVHAQHGKLKGIVLTI